MTMKKAIAGFMAAAAIGAALPATAGASQHGTPCRTAEPGFVQSLVALNTSCATARAVEHYWTYHELAPSWKFRAAGLTWHVAWTYRDTQISFGSGSHYVYIVHRPSM
jgi:hypothetical protein